MNYNISINETLATKMCSQELAIYYTLKRFMNHKTKQCFPSVATLANLLSWAENTVRKWLRSLQNKKFIKIEKRYKLVQGKRQNFSNLYTFLFEGVLQNKNKATSKDGAEHITIEQSDLIDTDSIKVELIKKYGQDIVDKALTQMKISTNKGTTIYDLKSYLEVVCSRLKAQIEIVKGISQVSNNKPQKTKNNGSNPVVNGWKSSNITLSAHNTNEELEEIMLKKRNKFTSK